jgi:deoxyribonuclease IV
VLYGAHVSSSGGISKAIDRAEELDCAAVQVFTQSPRMWRPTEHAPGEASRFRARRDEVGIGAVACHAPYLVNLASPDPVIHGKSVAALRATMTAASTIGADTVIVHLGSHLGAGLDAALARLVPPLRDLLELTSEDLWLCLENCAGAGGTIGRSVEELAAVVDALGRHPRLGLCLDSCHWWASGVDITSPSVLDAAVADVDTLIGLDRLRCIHVNDAASALGSNLDRHASIRAGVLGAELGVFLSHPAFQNLPAILETPGPRGHGPDREEVRRLRRLHRDGLRAASGRSGTRRADS